MSKKIGIIYCKRIQDSSCIGCVKCYKAASEGLGAFEGQDVEIVFKTSCGDCPGLVLPKVQLQMSVCEGLDRKPDEIYFATCVQKANGAMNCPMDLDGIKSKMEASFEIPIKVGTLDDVRSFIVETY